jgi:hypothetical protein
MVIAAAPRKPRLSIRSAVRIDPSRHHEWSLREIPWPALKDRTNGSQHTVD